MPSVANRTYLGEFSKYDDAVRAAKGTYKQVNGCYYCSNPCHTQ